MQKLKSHKTVEQIAKKHQMDVSFIQKQLDIGEPIEHEHTKDHELAMDIALQHLDEIPDYYTRLKKMEADAKKHHKKFKDVSESAISELESGLKKLSKPSYDSIDGLMRNIMKKHDMSAKELHNSFVKKHNKTPDAWIKKSHVKEDMEEKRYCPLCDKREGRSECSYGEKAWDKVSVKDEEYSMVRSELQTMSDAIKRLQMKVGKGEGNLEAWVQSKITKAADYIDTAADYVAGGEMEEACWTGYKQVGMKKKGKKIVPNCVPEETKLVDKILDELIEASKSGDSSLHDWFSKSKSSDGKPGWVQLGGKYAGKPCAKQPGQTTKPKCGSSKMAAEMSPEEEEKAARRKRKEDPNPERVGKAINVATEEFVDEDACKEKVKSRYKVWPSAYASGALVKCRKVGASNWGNKTNEDVTIEDLNGNTFAEVIDLIKPEPIKGFKSQVDEATRLQAQTGNVIAVILSWRGKYYAMKMFFPQVKTPSRKEINDELQKVYPGSIVVHHSVSEIQPGQPLIQVFGPQGGSSAKLGPNKNYVKPIGEEVAAWQRKEGKNPEGGLNRKGIASYRRENPGSKLSMAVTTPPSKLDPDSKAAKRRKSFCARMGGMPGPMKDEKGRPTRKALSLKKWNC
jgi:hypothetical protein